MNNKDFITSLAVRAGLNTKDTQKWVNGLVADMAEQLDDSTQLTIQGFGSFEVKKKMERVIVNPATKQRKLIPPKLVLAFKPGATLKEKMK